MIILKADLADALKINVATLTRRERGGTFPVAIPVAGTNFKGYEGSDVCAVLARLRRVDVGGRPETPDLWDGLVPEDWLTTIEVATRIGMSRHAVLRYARQKRIPHYRLGPDTVRFRAAELREWCGRMEARQSMAFWVGNKGARMRFEKWLNKERK